MNIEITGVNNLEVTTALKERAEKKFNKLAKFDTNITRINIVFKVEGHEHNAKATVHTTGTNMHADASSKDMYKTIDILFEKLLNQVSNSK